MNQSFASSEKIDGSESFEAVLDVVTLMLENYMIHADL